MLYNRYIQNARRQFVITDLISKDLANFLSAHIMIAIFIISFNVLALSGNKTS